MNNYRANNLNNQRGSNKSNSATSREDILGRLIILIGLIFLFRLFYIQIIKHADYSAIARAQHERKYVIPAKRGTIYFSDSNGKVVPAVLNTSVYSLYADPEEVDDPAGEAETLYQIIGGDKAKYQEQLSNKDSRYQVLAKRLSLEQANQIKGRDDLKGLGLTEVPQRYYPEGQVGSQLLGFVNGEGEGQYGIEGYYNDQLSGKDGVRRTIASVSGVPLTVIGDDSDSLSLAEDGAAVYLNIDRTVQTELEAALKETVEASSADSASAIIINPNNGKVIASGGYPSYNAGDYYKTEDASLFLNKSVSDGTEVGSVMKPLTMAGALDMGLVNKDTTFNNTNSVKVEDRTIGNATKTLHTGPTTMREVLENSMNTGMVFVVGQMGGGQINLQARQNLYHYFYDQYGFGQPTGIEQAGEAKGIMYSPDDQEGNNVRYSNMAFGQGVTVSLVQTSTAFSGVINGGTVYKPQIVDKIKREGGAEEVKQPEIVRSNIVKPSVSADIIDMLQTTGAKNNTVPKRDGYLFGGKTGTSQIVGADGSYTEGGGRGTFLGFLGADKPEYVMMVKVENPKVDGFAGGQTAAPVFKRVSNWLIDYYKIPPAK
jgi:cell division protein FtsI/penicillin-binding protein 2